MAKKSKAKPAESRDDVLQKAIANLKAELGYDSVVALEIAGETCALADVDGAPQVLIFVPESLDSISPADEELSIELAASVENGPANYVWATTSGTLNSGYIYSWLPDDECQVSEIPNADAAPATDKTAKRTVSADPLRFKELQREFDQLHEAIYASREPVDGSNDLTAQLCKLIFLKMHLEHHPDFQVPGDPLLMEVFTVEYIEANKEKAVEQIRKAFDIAKSSPDYTAKDDRGNDFRIFDEDDYIKFKQPATYSRVVGMLNKHQLTSPDATELEDDILGRAFDVMLRGKFEGKGGMGVYLTPQQVRDAMVNMVFHDILKEDSGAVTRRDAATNLPSFRVCDPCCGSAGFLVTAMREVRKHVQRLVGLSAVQQGELLSEIYSHGFVGADSAPNMILLARINMALHGDPKARAFRTENSLTSDVFLPETYDLILTNPPFKKGGIKADDNSDIINAYCSDIVDNEPQMEGKKLALGAKPNSKGVWKPVKSVDPAVLFIDRCLQLLRPGGRLVIVLPDGILCNSGDKYVREYLMGTKNEETGRFVGGKAIVKAVVSLPPITFKLSGAGAKTSFLYLQKKREGDEQGPVFMAVADHVGFDVKQNKEVRIDENDLTKIVEAYKSGPTEVQE